MANGEGLREAIRACPGGVGAPLSEEVLNEIRFGKENHRENAEPYNEETLIEGVGDFFNNHPFAKEFN